MVIYVIFIHANTNISMPLSGFNLAKHVRFSFIRPETCLCRGEQHDKRYKNSPYSHPHSHFVREAKGIFKRETTN